MNKMSQNNLIICVVGPTASGKSELAVKLAQKYNGEIISADSRQIYKGLNIGSGKVEGTWTKLASKKVFLYKDIPHYLIDEVDPAKHQFSVSDFQNTTRKVITKLHKAVKMPIICGGTGYFIDSVIFESQIPQIKPDAKLRSSLEHLTTQQLFNKLKKLDPDRAKNIDPQNPRRLIRALEIVLTTGKPVPKNSVKPYYENVLWIAINPDMQTLEKKIQTRLDTRFKEGMIEEVKTLHDNGLSWQKLEDFGLEYKFIAQFLQNKISEAQMKQLLFTAIRQYAKRQLTWWKRNKAINWFKTPALANKFISAKLKS